MPNTRTRGNGQGTVFKMQNGKWRAEITLGWDGNKRIVKTKSGFLRKRDALAAMPELRNTPIDVNTKITFKGLYDLWSGPHFEKVTKSTSDGYKSAYGHCGSLHYKQFTALKTADLQQAIDDCPLSRRSKADIKSLMTNLYKYAIENDYCNKNYAEYIKLAPKGKSKKEAFTDIEVKKLWDDYRSGNEFTGYILLMIYTGMRFGELARITKANIHIEDKYMVGGIKTAAGIDRVLPISDRILPIVQKFYQAGNKKILEMHEKVFYNTFYVTLDRLEIRKLNPHCCRHTFATLMANAGVQPAIITETAGHEDYSTTLQYTHIPLEEKLKAVNSLK